MAGYQCNYDGLNELYDVFMTIDADLKSQIKATAKEIGNSLKSHTESSIPKATEPRHGVHLADDVVMSVSVNDKSAKITVKGGKKTGGYWWLVDNGHIATNNNFIPGAHFTDKAYQMTDVEGPVENLLNEVVRNE